MSNADHDPDVIADNIDKAKALASNRRELNEWAFARLVQIIAGGGSAGVRAIDMLLGLPSFDRDDEEGDEVDAVAERYAVRFLLGKGYAVQPPEGGGPKELN